MSSITKPVFAGVLAAFATAGAAQAQSSTYDWTAFYIGGHVGADWRRSQIGPISESLANTTGLITPGFGQTVVGSQAYLYRSVTPKRTDLLWGGQIGAAYQTQSNWVLGIEGDVDARGRTERATELFGTGATALQSAGTLSVRRDVRPEWSWSARARVGYAFDRLQLYGTAGVAGVRMRVRGFDSFSTPGGATISPCDPLAGCPTLTGGAFTNTSAGRVTKSEIGWTLGGGADWAITDMFSLGVEYRHSGFGRHTFATGTTTTSFQPGAIGGPNNGAYTVVGGAGATLSPTPVKYSEDQVSMRLNVRFGRHEAPPPPPPPPPTTV